MRLFLAIAAALALAAPAGAAGARGLTRHDKQVIRFFQHHPRAAATPAGGRILSHLLPRLVVALHQRELLDAAEAAVPPDCRGGATAAACSWYLDGATQCEVAHEGGWTTDSNYPYAGRFQMDPDFETSDSFGRSMEARYGRASNWPPWAQIQHAYDTFLTRGWSPWPPYYRYGCGAYAGRSYA